VPAKSILDIDVNDASFRQFNALFQRYQQQLASTPLAWKNIALAQQQGVKGFRDLVLEQAAAIGQQRLLNEAHKAALNLLRQEESIWTRINRQTVGAAHNIHDISASLLEWSKITGVVSGLLGAGGLFGVTRLAQSVASGRSSSLGSFTTYGNQRAFGTAFGRFGDTNSLLGGVAGAMTDPSQSIGLISLGLRPKEGADSATVAAQVLTRAQQIAKGTEDQFLNSVFGMYHLGDLGLTMETFRQLKRSSPEELSTQQAQFSKLQRDYGVGADDQRAYQDLTTALDDAANQIETVFVKSLAPLIPDLKDLSGEVVTLVKALSDSGALKDALHDLTDAVKTADEFIRDPWKAITDIDQKAGAANGKMVSSITGGTTLMDIWRRGFGVGNGGGGTSTDSSSGSSTDSASAGGAASIVLPVKPGAGYLDPGLAAFARTIQSKYAGFGEITAGEDDYHKGFKSAHNDGRAFDFTIRNPGDAAMVADLVRSEMARQGIKGKVIDEYNYPSKNSTAPHIHVQTDVRISQPAGGNLIVSAQQVTPSP
jgi:hypothetical protein